MASAKESAAALKRVRAIIDQFPEVTERLSHGCPTWFIRGKRGIARLADNHHGDGILGLCCSAPPGVQAELIETEPDRFYRPAYVGPLGWIGVRLDRSPDWDEVEAILFDAYRNVAPKTLTARLDSQQT